MTCSYVKITDIRLLTFCTGESHDQQVELDQVQVDDPDNNDNRHMDQTAVASLADETHVEPASSTTQSVQTVTSELKL